jgi:hypothetical protein
LSDLSQLKTAHVSAMKKSWGCAWAVSLTRTALFISPKQVRSTNEYDD